MEHGVGMETGAGELGLLQLVLRDILDEVVHLIRILQVIDQGVLDLAQVVALLKNAGSHKCGLVAQVAVHGVVHALAHIPHAVGDLREVRRVDVVLPVLDVLDDDLVRGVHREGRGGGVGESIGHAPGVHRGFPALFGHGGDEHGGIEYHAEALKLVDIAIRFSADDALAQVFLCGKHLHSSSFVGRFRCDLL